MLELGMANALVFFLAIAGCLSFVVVWIIKADSKRGIFRDEIERLKSRIDAYEREKIMSPAEAAGAAPSDSAAKAETGRENKALQKNAVLLMQSMKQIEELDRENKKLKSELEEAKGSMEEIYKAIIGNKQ